MMKKKMEYKRNAAKDLVLHFLFVFTFTRSPYLWAKRFGGTLFLSSLAALVVLATRVL